MTTTKKNYTKYIIEEYNARLQTWGNSDSWGLTEFNMLEELIYQASNMRINANTLKRFFQQKTSNPQIATYNALCIFLGYSSYAEFILKKNEEAQNINDTDSNETIDNQPEEDSNDVSSNDSKSNKKHRKFSSNKYIPPKRHIFVSILVILIGIVAFVCYNNRKVFQQKREAKLIADIIFESGATKGTSPFTTKINYYIPQQLPDSFSLVCIEANGDHTIRQVSKDKKEIYASFIYPGKGLCQLVYKGKTIKTIEVESRTPGWSVYLKEERSDYYLSLPFSATSTENNYLTLPITEIPNDAITDKLFVSYTYYQDSIIDGDNFIFEARVRNSSDQDNGVPCNDIMMYIFSNTGLHGFALNENCYSYLKFISSENTIMGDQHDLSRLNFNPDLWHVMKIEVKNKRTFFYLDNQIVNQMQYKNNLGTANELTLRFKGCGAVDYVKVKNLAGESVYEKYFRK